MAKKITSPAEQYVTQSDIGLWDFQCPGPVDSPCGPLDGPGFASTGWPEKSHAVARGQQHIDEHKDPETPAQPMEDFMPDQGLTVASDGAVVKVEDLA